MNRKDFLKKISFVGFLGGLGASLFGDAYRSIIGKEERGIKIVGGSIMPDNRFVSTPFLDFIEKTKVKK